MLPDWSFLQSIKYSLRHLNCDVEIDQPADMLNYILIYPHFLAKHPAFTTAPYYGITEGKYQVGRRGSILELVDNRIVEKPFDHTRLLTIEEVYNEFGRWPMDSATVLAKYMRTHKLSFEEIFNRSKEADGDFGKLIDAIDIYVKNTLHLGAPEGLLEILKDTNSEL